MISSSKTNSRLSDQNREEISATTEPDTRIPEMAGLLSSRMTRRGMARSKGSRRSRVYPPTIPSELKGHHVFRYTGTVAQEADITVATLLRAAMAVNTATSARPIFTSVRLKKVSVWTPVQTIGGAPTFCAVRFEGTNTDDVTLYDTSAVVDDMAHVSRTPPAMSIAGFWHHSDVSDTSLKLAWVSCGPDSIIDIALEYVMDDTGVNSTYTFTGASGLITGTLVYGSFGAYTQPGKSSF